MQGQRGIDVNGCIDLAAAVVKKACEDYRRGPGIGKHSESAQHFLRDAGLLPAGQQRNIDKEYIHGYTTIEPRRTGPR